MKKINSCLLALWLFLGHGTSHILAAEVTGYQYPFNTNVLIYAPGYSGTANGAQKYVNDEAKDFFKYAKFFKADQPINIRHDTDASLNLIRSFGDYGSIFIHTHGWYWQGQELFSPTTAGIAIFRSGTIVPLPPALVGPGPERSADLENFRLAISKKPDQNSNYHYAVFPGFIDKYVEN